MWLAPSNAMITKLWFYIYIGHIWQKDLLYSKLYFELSTLLFILHTVLVKSAKLLEKTFRNCNERCAAGFLIMLLFSKKREKEKGTIFMCLSLQNVPFSGKLHKVPFLSFSHLEITLKSATHDEKRFIINFLWLRCHFPSFMSEKISP